MSCCGNPNESQRMEKQTLCPVMKNPVNEKVAEGKGMVREYQGKKYYFCCDSCPETFEKNPTSYIE